MYHQVAVGVLHGAADLHEQTQALLHIELIGVAVVRDGGAVDVFHHEVGLPLVRDAAV